MQKIITSIFIFFLLTTSYATDSNREGTLFQVSTIGALAQGVYDSNYHYSQLFKHGDFGLGTFNHLNGEMVAVDGKFYQILGNGKLHVVTANQLTPFAEVTFFKPTQQFTMQNVSNLHDITEQLQKAFNNKNIPYAFRIDGDFATLTSRSVPEQHQPYPHLAKAAKHEYIFKLTHTKGTIVGYYFPQYWSAIAVAGFHLHYVTADRTTGGHVLDAVITNAHVFVQPLYHVDVSLLNTQEFAAVNLEDQNINTQIRKAEQNPNNTK